MKILIAGFYAGFVSGLFSSGGGMILVPFFTLFLKEDESKARATTIFCVFFMVMASSLYYYKQSFIDFNISLKCAFGGILGGIIGSKLLIKLDDKILKILFIFFLIYTGVKMVL